MKHGGIPKLGIPMPQSSTFSVVLSKKYKRGADDDVFVSLMLPLY